jgi:hypothetical protein
MSDSTTREVRSDEEMLEQRFLLRYLVLTLAIFLPLIAAFVTLSNVYPVASWTVMMAGGNLPSGHRYFVLRGETASGELIDIPPITLTDGLSGRIWGLVAATVDNRGFQLRSPHPDNAALLAGSQGTGTIPRAARLPELLRAWGEIYNSRLPASSPGRLRALRLDAYQWSGGNYSDYDQFIESWRVEL